MFWAVLTTFAFGLAALAILINRQASLAARLTGLMVALFGVLVWIPHVVANPKAHFLWSECVLTFLVAGAVSTAGELSFLWTPLPLRNAEQPATTASPADGS